MSTDALIIPPPTIIKPLPHHRRDANVDVDSQREAKRPKRESDIDEYAAATCLISIARAAASKTAEANNRAYPCGVCGKIYPSYQALGGHMTTHRTRPPSVAAPENLIPAEKGNPSPIDSGGAGAHKCNVCGKAFTTGQSLGGHKRKHFTGVIVKSGGEAKSVANHSEDGSGASVVTSNDGGGDDVATPVRRIWLDLNLPPPPELELGLNLLLNI